MLWLTDSSVWPHDESLATLINSTESFPSSAVDIMWLREVQIHPTGQMLQWRPTVSAYRINRGKCLKSCLLGELQCHWRLHECDINPAALKIISAGIRAGQSSQPGAGEETGATSGLSRRSCAHVVQSRLGERMPVSIKKKKKISQLLFFFSPGASAVCILGL